MVLFTKSSHPWMKVTVILKIVNEKTVLGFPDNLGILIRETFKTVGTIPLI